MWLVKNLACEKLACENSACEKRPKQISYHLIYLLNALTRISKVRLSYDSCGTEGRGK
jgi:hypothetical protein